MARQRDLEFLQKDMCKLEKLLQRAVPRDAIGGKDPSNLRILNLACGECHESEVLMRAFRHNCERPTQDECSSIELVGLDIRSAELAAQIVGQRRRSRSAGRVG